MCRPALIESKEEYDRIYSDFRIITSEQLSGRMDPTRAKDAWKIVLTQADLAILGDVLADILFELSRDRQP